MANIFQINGREYEWADISIVFGGVSIDGFRKIEYEKTREKEPMYAKGRDAYSIQSGNNAVTGTITFTQSQLEALEVAVGDMLDVKVDIVVAYGAELNAPSLASAVISTEIIISCEFTKLKKGMSQGDKFMEIEMPFLGLKIKKV